MSTAGPPSNNPSLPAAAGSGPDYHLEAYKMLGDMCKQEDSIFWTRNQTFLLLNSGLVAILVGILGLQSKQPAPTASAIPVTSQSVPTPSAGPPSSITIQQIVNPATASPTGPGTLPLWFPLVSICALGLVLCIVWALIIWRAQGLNDHLVIHMKYLEEKYLTAITNMRMFDKLFTKAVNHERRPPKLLPDTMAVSELTVLDASGISETPRLPRLGSLVRVYAAWRFVAFFFAILWAVLGGWILLSK